MWTILTYALRGYRGAVLGWGLGLAVLGVILIPFYDVFLEQEAQLQPLIEAYPPELMAFFGGSFNITNPASYLNTYLSFIPAIAGIFTILAGAGMIAGDEEGGRLDLILAYPISRAQLYWGRVAAYILATLGIMFVTYLGFALPLGGSPMPVTYVEMAMPFLSMFAVILSFGVIALFFSQVLTSRRMAAAVAGAIMVAGYFLTSLKSLNEDLTPIARLLPYDYYQGGNAVEGLNAAWFLGLLVVSAVLIVAAWRIFERRDIRVGGEGGIELGRLTSLLRLRRAAS